MFAPLRAASRMSDSARRQLASTSVVDANWTAATVMTRGAEVATAAATAAVLAMWRVRAKALRGDAMVKVGRDEAEIEMGGALRVGAGARRGIVLPPR